MNLGILARMGLSLRLMLGVAAGFFALSLALGFLAFQALEESNKLILDQRQAITTLAATEIDRFLEQAYYELQKATDFAPFDPEAKNLEAEMHMMAHAYGRLGSFSRGVSFLDRNGRVVLNEPFGPELIGRDLGAMPPIREALL